MAAAKRTVRRTSPPAARDERGRLARSWDQTRATLEQRARALMKTSGVDPDKAAERLAALRQRLDRERRKAVKRVEGRLVGLRARAKKERRVLTSKADEAVHRALVALDIPSRKELHELTRRIEDLTRKIDALQRRRAGAPPKKTVKRR